MKKIIFILIIQLFSRISFGQNNIPFPTNNSTWTMDIQTQGMTFPPQTSHQLRYFKTSGDTLINGNLFTKINTSNNSNYCFIREVNGLVFCKYSQNTFYDTTEFVLFNFNLVQGDTLSLPMAGGTTINYYPGTVFLVDSILIGNTLHKRIHISSWISFDFVEGIGSLQGLMYPEIPWVDFWGDLTCFSRNDTIYSLNGDGQYSLGKCWWPTSIYEVEPNTTSVYPNPSSNFITVNAPLKASVEIININNQLIKSLIIKSGITTIDVSDLSNGVYFFKMNTEKGSSINKFIKQ